MKPTRLFPFSGRSGPLDVPRTGRCRLTVERLEDRLVLSDGYSLQPLAFLGDPEPKGANFTFDFEPGTINSSGQVSFGADLSSGGEGVFLLNKDKITTLGRAGDPTPAPDSGTFGPFFYGELSLNDAGDMPFVFQRTPPTLVDTDGDGVPESILFGDNAGLYFFDHKTGAVTPRLLPGAPAPGGGSFHGFSFRASINNGGDIAFSGITPETIGPGFGLGLGQGIYSINKKGIVSKVVRPGDPAPGGDTFDFAQIPWINDRGDVVFGGHVASEPCIQFAASNIPGAQLFCADSLYTRDARTGTIRSVAHIGDAAPGGGKFLQAYGGKVNNAGQIAFLAELPASPPGSGHLPLDGNSGVFFNTGGTTTAIARPGDPMPGGGNLVTAGFLTADLGINNNGTVAFAATITDINGDGSEDNGLYTWANGTLNLVAHTGTAVPGAGTIEALKPPDLVGVVPYTISGATINNRGQIVFSAALADGTGVMLLATLHGSLTAPFVSDSAPLGTVPAGFGNVPVPGRFSVFVSSGLSAGERASVHDAIGGLNSALESFGVSLGEVGGARSADIRIDLGTTSPCGGAAQGVLGCASSVGDITLVNGWNWYTGRDPRLIRPGQYDFETAVTHELGHALGLEHSSDSGSFMYGTLWPGASRRLLGETKGSVLAQVTVPSSIVAILPQEFRGTASGELEVPSSVYEKAVGGDLLAGVALRGFAGSEATIAPVQERVVGLVIEQLGKKVRSLLDDNLQELLTDLALALGLG